VRLILNAKSLRPPLTGVGNYTYHLLEQYVKGQYADEVHCFSGTRWQTGPEQLAVASHIRSLQRPIDRKASDALISELSSAISRVPGVQALYSHFMDRRFERTANAIPDAVYHETNYVLRPYAGPCVTTVHDLSHIRYPEYQSDYVIEWLGQNLRESLSRADYILTVSNIVRAELIDCFDVPEEKVRTVYEGVDHSYKPRNQEQTMGVLSLLGLRHKHYILLSATLEPRKGIDVLLDAWSLLPASLRREFPLVLTGSSGWHNEDLLKKLKVLMAEGGVHHLGYVPADVLAVLFSGASIFCYPSVYEGFGLPVLDAMSSGVPVICRAGTSMAEFSQGACLLCDTATPEELAFNIEMLLNSRSAQEAWAQKGLVQAAQFSWERCAAETNEIYRLIS
jgi:glycosyltransferase involved in cell wall biosynthesis